MRWLKKALGMTGRKAAEDLCTRGYVAAREGRLEVAQKLYDDACDADPTLAVGWFNAGQTALERFNRDAAHLDNAGRAERLRTAAAHLSRALDADENHLPSWRALARVHERLGRLDAAFGAWGRVEACLGTTGLDEHGHAIDGVRGVADGVADGVSGGVSGGVDVNAARIEARRERARLKNAAALVVATTRVKDLLADVHDVAAAVAAAAVDDLLAARDAADGEPAPFVSTQAGALARKAGDVARARELLDGAVASDPRDLEAWRNLATVCLTQADLPAALKASLAAYRLDPVDAGLVCNLGVCHLAAAAAGHGSLAQAREYIELAARLAPRDPIVVRAVAALTAHEAPRST